MSVKYIPVQWNRNKWLYDAALILAVLVYILAFIEFGARAADATRPVDGQILRMRAFGTCAFLMLTVILCIGPLARINRRFLPLLYNRRHFGVLTTLVAFTHAAQVLNWYFVFAPTPPLENLLVSNTSYGQLLGFPFEVLGIFGLLVLVLLAATSHDFWLSFLGAPAWKALHLAIYPAYAAIVGHVWLGYLQDTQNPAFALVAGAGGLTVAGLHLAARGRPAPARGTKGWVDAGRWDAIPDGRAVILRLRGEERVAIFRNGATLSAVSNACAHQNGPLGEGRIIDGCITCPWHGFQYRPQDGRSPAPFTERIPTYNLQVEGAHVFVDPQANPPGTPARPAPLPKDAAAPAPERGGSFFIGFAPPKPDLAGFLGLVAIGLVAGFAVFGWLLAATQDDPGDGAFRFDYGRQTMTGTVQARPYPVLHVTESDRFAKGHTLLLSGVGKFGAQDRADALDGQAVTASGVVLERGALDMLQLAGGEAGLAATGALGAVPTSVPRGRWRITGEICDGKCYSGAMRPGTGLSHKACANLCLTGGVPPVLVTTAPVEGERFLLIGNADGGPVTEALLDFTATLVEVEGRVERRGSLLVFLIEPDTLRVVP